MSYVEAGDDFKEYVVQPKCTEGYAGCWWCAHHGSLQNNMTASQHDQGGCKLAWFCYEHMAYEVP